MSKYTPGPFDVRESGIPGQEQIRILSGNLVVAVLGTETRNLIELNEARANAVLFSASTEMLDALNGAETFLEMYLADQRESDARLAERDGYSTDYVSDHTKNIEEDLAAVKSAISKAEGRS